MVAKAEISFLIPKRPIELVRSFTIKKIKNSNSNPYIEWDLTRAMIPLLVLKYLLGEATIEKNLKI
jgi:hypothetical protein